MSDTTGLFKVTLVLDGGHFVSITKAEEMSFDDVMAFLFRKKPLSVIKTFPKAENEDIQRGDLVYIDSDGKARKWTGRAE